MLRSGSVNREPLSRNESGRRGVESASDMQNGRTLSRNESMASMAGGHPSAQATVTFSRRANKAKPQTYSAMLTRWVAKVQKKGFREFERKRRNWPGLNFIMEYGIKQAAAALFLADIVSDIIVSAAFLGEANNAERCGVEPLWARTFAIFSVFFILMPLILTALFITGVQRRSFVYRKQLHELQLSMQDVVPGGPNFVAHHKAKQSFGADMMSGNFTQQNISTTMRMAQFSEHTMGVMQAANNVTYVPPPPAGGNPYYAARFDGVQGYTHLADNPDAQGMAQPAAARHQQPDHTLLGRPPRGAGGVAEGLSAHILPAASWDEEGFEVDASGRSQASQALISRVSGTRRLATAVGEARYNGKPPQGHPASNGHGHGHTQNPNPHVYTPSDAAMAQQPQAQGQRPGRRRRNRSVEEYVEHSSKLADEWEDPAFSYGGPQAPTPQAGTGHIITDMSDPANLQQQSLLGPNDLKKVSDVEKLERQSLICAILAFPLMLFAAVGLDVALVIVSLYPNVAFFIGFESVMPAYFAYRILVEVVLEALPQVLLQLIAFRTRPETAAKGFKEGCNGQGTYFGFSTDQIIVLSIVIAVLNLFKTMATLYYEASSLEMGMMQYIRYLGEVGSTRLPLRSIAENTIGQKLTYEAVSQENELPPLFAAIRTNTSIKVMSVLKLKGKDIVRLVKTLERRFLPYALDISETAFNDMDHMALVMELLRSRHAQHVSFRSCTSTCSHWLRQEAFMYLRLHLPGGCTDDNQVPAASVESDTREVQEFADRLVDEWLHPCRVLKLSGRSKEWKQKGGFQGASTPVDVAMHTPQRASTLHAAFYFLSQNCTISSCECSYTIAPASLASLLALLQSSHGISKLKLSGARAAFDEEAPMALASTLAASNGLRRLYLVRMFEDEAPMKPVMSSLAQCPHLSDLVLTGNKLGQVLCSMLGKLLLKFNDLRRLCIDACQIDDGAAAALATAIMSPKKPFSELRQLAFGGNNMSPAGLSSIARTFQHCSKLEELDLSCTPISSEPPIQHTPTGTSTTAMYDLLAALDHSTTDDPPQGPGPAGRTISSGPGAMTRGGSMMNGTITSNTNGVNSSGQHRMLVWSSAMVRALSVLLKLAPSVRCNGCVWHGSALEALSDCLRDNSHLQLVNIRMNEKQWDAKRDMPLSKMLGELASRQRDGMASLKFIDFGGLPTGKMNQLIQRSGELMGRVQNLCVTCNSLRGDFREGPDTLQVNDFSQLLPLVKATTGLKQLRLHAPALTAAPVDFFRTAAASLSGLTTLSLSAVNLGASETRPSLLDCISGPDTHPLANIADLSLRGCFLGDDGARSLVVLLEKMPRLESLCLPDNRISKTGFSMLINDWEKPGRSPSRLHTLDLSYNSIGIDGARELAKVLHTLPSLAILRLAAVEMGSRGVAAISDAFLSAAEDNAQGPNSGPGESGEMGPTAVTLIQLDLENNEIGDNGTEDLADALMVMPHLQVLKLAGNRPAFEGTQAIMNSVGTLSALQVLTLGDAIGTRYNRKQPVAGGGMTWEGIHLFATRLPQIAGLRELRMLGLGAPLISGFMDEVMFELCSAVRQLPSLQVIDLRGLGFVSPVAAAEIAHAVQNSPALSLVDFSGCHLGPGAVEVLRTHTASATCHVLLQGTD